MPYFLLIGAAIAAATSVSQNQKTIVKVPIVNVPAPPGVFVPEPPLKGQQSGPVPKSNPGAWVSTIDYPTGALMEYREGAVGFSLSVDAQGDVVKCDVVASSGHPDLDEATCSNVVRRAKFYPAQDKSGKQIAGDYANRVRWQIPETFSSISPPIADDSLPRPPKLIDWTKLRIGKEDYPAAAMAARFEGRTRFYVEVDKEGTAQSCRISNTSGSDELDSKACDLARAWKYEPARDSFGAPVSGRSSHSVNWQLPKAALANVTAAPITAVNPFEVSGSMKLTLDFDKDGKTINCTTEHVGEIKFLPSSTLSPVRMCDNAATHRAIKPFTSATGEAEPRRVILKIAIEHEALPDASKAGSE